MASWFTIGLDTTAPLVEIHSPTYTLRGIDNEIQVVANEQLAPYQEIYTVDSLGVRRNYTFLHQGDRFKGNINFNSYPVGSVEIYATVRDVVHNTSAQVHEIITILSDNDALRLKVDIDDFSRDVFVSDGSLVDISVGDYDPTT